MGSKVKAGEAFVELTTQDTKFQKGLLKAQNKLKKFGESISSIGTSMMKAGGVIVAAFGAATAVFMKVGDDLDKMAARTGMSVEALSQLKFAAQQSGTSIEDVEKAVRKMNEMLAKTKTGSAEAKQAFQL